MFGGGGPFGNPFENMHRQMRQMDNMMNAMLGDAFNMLDGMEMPHHPMLTNDATHRRVQQHPFDNMMMSPFGGFGGFGPPLFGGMFGQMQNLQERAMHDPNSVIVSESTMISFDPSGQPKVVQSSTRKAGNVKETRRTVRDGEKQEVAIGHSIGDKTHIVEKKRDKSGKVRQQQKFINMHEDEARDFNEQFKSQARNNLNGIYTGQNHYNQNAIENGRGIYSHGRDNKSTSGYHQNASETSAPIITVPDDDDEEEPNGSRRGRRGDDDIIYLDSRRSGGPTIQEIVEDDETDANPKRRKHGKGLFGKFMG